MISLAHNKDDNQRCTIHKPWNPSWDVIPLSTGITLVLNIRSPTEMNHARVFEWLTKFLWPSICRKIWLLITRSWLADMDFNCTLVEQQLCQTMASMPVLQCKLGALLGTAPPQSNRQLPVEEKTRSAARPY